MRNGENFPQRTERKHEGERMGRKRRKRERKQFIDRKERAMRMAVNS